jgi:hypothetical protein
MNTIYTPCQLEGKKIQELKAIASEMNIVPEGNKRVKQIWIDAILQSQPQKEIAQPAYAQSGELFFEQIASSTHSFRIVYKVSCGGAELGRIGKNWGGRWLVAGGSGKDFDTPYEAAAFLEESRLASQSQEISAQLREYRAQSIEVLEVRDNEEYLVRNSENGNHYVVRPHESDPYRRCGCGDCRHRGVKCKHQTAVSNFISSRLESLLDKPFDELTPNEWGLLRQQSESDDLVTAAA